MKYLMLVGACLALTTPTFGQKSRSLDSLSRKEIRNLILNQSDAEPEAREMMIKHRNSRRTSHTFLAFTTIIIGVGIANGSNQKTRSGAAANTALVVSGSILTLIPAGISALVANSRFEKSKKMYLDGRVP